MARGPRWVRGRKGLIVGLRDGRGAGGFGVWGKTHRRGRARPIACRATVFPRRPVAWLRRSEPLLLHHWVRQALQRGKCRRHCRKPAPVRSRWRCRRSPRRGWNWPSATLNQTTRSRQQTRSPRRSRRRADVASGRLRKRRRRSRQRSVDPIAVDTTRTRQTTVCRTTIRRRRRDDGRRSDVQQVRRARASPPTTIFRPSAH